MTYRWLQSIEESLFAEWSFPHHRRCSHSLESVSNFPPRVNPIFTTRRAAAAASLLRNATNGRPNEKVAYLHRMPIKIDDPCILENKKQTIKQTKKQKKEKRGGKGKSLNFFELETMAQLNDNKRQRRSVFCSEKFCKLEVVALLSEYR